MNRLAPCFLGFFLAACACAQAAEQAPQPVPDAEHRSGETLTERLDRTDSVIKPPPVDAPIQIDPPKNDSNMPILKPSDAPPQQSSPNDAGK